MTTTQNSPRHAENVTGANNSSTTANFASKPAEALSAGETVSAQLRPLDLLGAPLFLLRPGGKIKGKYAAPSAWERTSADDNDKAITGWKPGYGVGMVCGQAYDVIDVDPRNGGDASLAQMQEGGLIPPVQRVVKTPSGGLHLYVSPLGVRKAAPLDGIDLQAQGSYVFAPPTEGYQELPPEAWPAIKQSPDGADRLRALVGKRDTALAVQTDARPYDTLSQHEQEQARQRVQRTVKGFSDRLDAAQHWDDGQRDEQGRGWEKLSADAAFTLGQLGHAAWSPLSLADAEAEFTEMLPDVIAHDSKCSGKWGAQVSRAASKPMPAPWQEDFSPVVEDEAPAGHTDAPSPEGRYASIRQEFPRLDLAALLDANRPRRQWVVSGLISAGTSVAFVAKAGSMKSLLLLALSLAVARGDEDFAGLTIPRQRRVCYVDMENTEDDLEERLRDLGVQPADMQELIYLHLPSLKALDAEEGGQQIADICDAYELQKGDMVVLDSFQRVVEGPENDSDTYRDFYKYTGYLLKKRGLTVIRTDNTGKDESKGSRGSSSKRDDVDIEFIIKRDQAEDALHITPGKVRINGIEPVSLTAVTDDNDRLTFTSAGDPFRDQVMDAWRELDGLGLPQDASQRQCEDAMKGAKSKVPRTAIRQAAKERKARAESAPRTDGALTGSAAP